MSHLHSSIAEEAAEDGADPDNHYFRSSQATIKSKKTVMLLSRLKDPELQLKLDARPVQDEYELLLQGKNMFSLRNCHEDLQRASAKHVKQTHSLVFRTSSQHRTLNHSPRANYEAEESYAGRLKRLNRCVLGSSVEYESQVVGKAKSAVLRRLSVNTKLKKSVAAAAAKFR